MDKNHRPVLPMSSFPLPPTRLVRRGHGTARSARHGTPQNWLERRGGLPPQYPTLGVVDASVPQPTTATPCAWAWSAYC
jgi:hypothetical protein